MKYPLVSIIILTYNKFDLLENAIKSVLIQDYPNIELLIFDDCSYLFPKEQINKSINNKINNNIKNIIINQNFTNLGTVKNFNKAIQLTNGEYIVPLAGDDEFADIKVISDIVAFFKSTNCLILTGLRDVYDNTLTYYKETLPLQEDISFLKRTPLCLYKRLSIENFISGSCTPFSKNLINKYGYFNENYFLIEDYSRYLNLTRNNELIYFFNRVLIKYRKGGVSSLNNFKFKLDYLKIMENEILPYKYLFNSTEYKLIKAKYFNLSFAYYKGISDKQNFTKLIIKNIDLFLELILKKISKKVKVSIQLIFRKKQ